MRELWHDHSFSWQRGVEEHEYGEGAQAHHRKHIKLGGLPTLDNCVILCQSCHYSAHEGNYRLGKVVGRKIDFPYFQG